MAIDNYLKCPAFTWANINKLYLVKYHNIQ